MAHYFYIDFLGQKVNFITIDTTCEINPQVADSHNHTIVSFNQFFIMLKEIQQNEFTTSFQNLCNQMIYSVSRSKDNNITVANNTNNLRGKYQHNHLAIISIDLVYATYKKQRDSLLNQELSKSILDAFTEKYIKKAEEKIVNAQDDIFKNFINLNISKKSSSVNEFTSLKYLYIENTSSELILYDINETVEPLIHHLLHNISATGFCKNKCMNCGRYFLDYKPSSYCDTTECQHVYKMEVNKKNRITRKDDKYKSLLDRYNGYCRQIKSRISKNLSNPNAITEFSREQKKCREEVKNYIQRYADTNKTIDQELQDIVMKNKKHLITLEHKLIHKYGGKK